MYNYIIYYREVLHIQFQVNSSESVDVDYLTDVLGAGLELVAISNRPVAEVRLDRVLLDFCLPCDFSSLRLPGGGGGEGEEGGGRREEWECYAGIILRITNFLKQLHIYIYHNIYILVMSRP